MDVVIRIAQNSDISALTNLFNSDVNLLGEDNTGYGETDVHEYVADPRKKMFVYEYSGHIVGALLADYHNTYVYLDTLVVSHDFQKQGIGSKLLDHLEDDLSKNNIPLIEVLTSESNKVMQKILASRGFRKGNTFIFYSKGE
jgi:ribosomal protein S18 acetylase RimI-like enzyme